MTKDAPTARFLMMIGGAVHAAFAPLRFLFWLAEGIVTTTAAAGILCAVAWAIGLIPDAVVADVLVALGERVVAIFQHLLASLKN